MFPDKLNLQAEAQAAARELAERKNKRAKAFADYVDSVLRTWLECNLGRSEGNKVVYKEHLWQKGKLYEFAKQLCQTEYPEPITQVELRAKLAGLQADLNKANWNMTVTIQYGDEVGPGFDFIATFE